MSNDDQPLAGIAAWLKLAAAIAGLVFWGMIAFALLGGCGSSDDTRSSSTSTSKSVAAGVPPSVKYDIIETPDKQNVQVSFDVTDRHGYGLRASAQQDTIEILRRVRTAYPNADHVLVTGYHQMKDQYGHTARRPVMSVAYERSTLNRINFDGIGRAGIWDVRDGGFGFRNDCC